MGVPTPDLRTDGLPVVTQGGYPEPLPVGSDPPRPKTGNHSLHSPPPTATHAQPKPDDTSGGKCRPGNLWSLYPRLVSPDREPGVRGKGRGVIETAGVSSPEATTVGTHGERDPGRTGHSTRKPRRKAQVGVGDRVDRRPGPNQDRTGPTTDAASEWFGYRVDSLPEPSLPSSLSPISI